MMYLQKHQGGFIDVKLQHSLQRLRSDAPGAQPFADGDSSGGDCAIGWAAQFGGIFHISGTI